MNGRLAFALLALLVIQAASAVQDEDICKLCDGLGNNSYPVLNELQVATDGRFAMVEIISCSHEPSILGIPEYFFLSNTVKKYPVNYGFNVLPSVGVLDNREIAIYPEGSMLGNFYIARIFVPDSPGENMSYQRVPDMTGPFVWAPPTFGKPNSGNCTC